MKQIINQKNSDYLQKIYKSLPVVVVIIVVVTFGALSYIAFFPAEDQSVKESARIKNESLNMNLSLKRFDSLVQVVGGKSASGRNVFTY